MSDTTNNSRRIAEMLGKGQLMPKRFAEHQETSRAELEMIGFKVLGDLKWNPFLFRTKSPKGWTFVDKSRKKGIKWVVLDANNNERMTFTWLQGSQIDSAVTNIWRRYVVSRECRGNRVRHFVLDRATDKRIFETEYELSPAITYKDKENGRTRQIATSKSCRIYDSQKEKCEQWLDDRFPDWRNPGAHWQE